MVEYFLVSTENYPVNTPTSISLQQNNLAYIIYASASTGNPKGVIIEHHNLLNYLFDVIQHIDPDSRNSACFAHFSMSFDGFITELFLPLISGTKLIITARVGLKIFDDVNLFKYAPCNFIILTPSHVNLIVSVINKEIRSKLSNHYIIAGEALYNYHINQFRSSGNAGSIVNL